VVDGDAVELEHVADEARRAAVARAVAVAVGDLDGVDRRHHAQRAGARQLERRARPHAGERDAGRQVLDLLAQRLRRDHRHAR
jgi:hypothetical protein